MKHEYYSIDDISLPIIVIDEIKYYPIRFVFEKILGKSKQVIRHESIQHKIVDLNVKYFNTGSHLSKCLNEHDLLNAILDCVKIERLVLSKIYYTELFFDILEESILKDTLINKLKNRKLELLEYENVSSDFLYDLYNLNSSKFPNILKYKPNLLKLIFELHKNNEFDIENNDLVGLLKSKSIPLGIINVDEVYTCIYGDEYKMYAYKFKNVSFRINNKEDAFDIFTNYITDKNITLDYLYNNATFEVFRGCRLSDFIKKNYHNSQAEFLVDYFKVKNIEFKARLMKNAGKNYWKNEENRSRELKSFIIDMEIKENYIPMYLSANYLNTHNRTLRGVLHKYHDDNIYNFVNEAYPNKFEEDMFHMAHLKNDFDSRAEFEIDEWLRKRFSNVIYNSRNNQNTVRIEGMIPDWLIINDGEVFVVEYFGMYIGNQTSNTRISDYIDRTDKKINLYMNSNYKCLFIFPEDIMNNFEKLSIKLESR